MLPVVSPYKFRGKHLFFWFPSVIGHGVSFPPYQVLQFAPAPKESMPHDFLDFELLFSVNHFGRRVAIVLPMLRSLAIGGQQRGVKDVMNGPGWGEGQLISDG
jgi:hypothetical protein